MTVSKLASEIYQAAKKAATGEWIWNSEWSKAMKQAWKEVISATVKETIEDKLNQSATFSCFDKYEIEAGAKITLRLETTEGKWTVYSLIGKDGLTQGDCNRMKSNFSRITGKPSFSNIRSRQVGFLNN